MKKNKKQESNISGVMCYAKTPGPTSFSSLWSIKHALQTEKVGHTGTLDSFAEGLLVVLAGNLTHLVPHITGFTKTYQAVVCFGKETDTLDPSGRIVAEGDSPDKSSVEEAIKKFEGAILQVPPVYSAVHVGGKRASDVARSGKEVKMESRQVFVYRIDLLDFKAPADDDKCSYALLEIVCSKGTYIRALARDIAKSLGTVAHLSALRRTQVGPFKLEDAACFSLLKEFTIENGILNEKKFSCADRDEKKREPDSMEKIEDIKRHFMFFTPELAGQCGFECDILKKDFERSFLNGRPLSAKMFEILPHDHIDTSVFNNKEIAVFYKDNSFAGIIKKNEEKRLSYGFVVHPKSKEFKVISWHDVTYGDFPVEFFNRGTALTVGSFEAVHKGHLELIDSVKACGGLVPGIITFSSGIKDEEEVFSLRQRLSYFEEAGLSFAVVIDFNEDFASLSGEDFVDVLVKQCNMKFLAEGRDFRCGYKGLCSMMDLAVMARSKGFELKECDDVIFDGERISSTRVRSEVARGNFCDIQKMVQRPFSFDAEGLKWKEHSSGFEAAAANRQVLPEGLFEVAVRMDDGTVLHCSCQVHQRKILLTLPTRNFAEKVREIVFA